MSSFKSLKELSEDFDAELQNVYEDLKTVRLARDPIVVTNKKIRDYSLFLSKLRLLRGKEHAATEQVQDHVQSTSNTINNFEDTAQNKIISDMLTKYVCTNKVVSELMKKKDGQLDDHEKMVKELIISKHSEFRVLNSQLLSLDSMLTEHEEMLTSTRSKWDQILGELRNMRSGEKIVNEESPMHEKLTKLLDKLELIRWLMSCLMLSPCVDYDWISDPDKLANMRPLTRFHNNIENIAMAGRD